MLRRRLLTIPTYLVAWLLWLVSVPLWLPLAAVVDIVRRRRGAAIRCGAMLGVYLSCEVIGLAASFGLWSWRAVFGMDDERWLEIHHRLEAWWGATLFAAVVTLFGIRVGVEGEADLASGPYLLLGRHASAGDTLLAAALVCRPYGMRLRYVLKRELLWDPCLDVVGHRLPNTFTDRSSVDSAGELERVRALGQALGSRDGVLIYPEGTRFSKAKRERVIARLRERGDEELAAFAASLESVLPPRIGGTLSLIEASPGVDVVICAHTGFEGSASVSEVWDGALVGRVIRVRFERIARADIPDERESQIAWLCDEWRRLDAWVKQNVASGGLAT